MTIETLFVGFPWNEIHFVGSSFGKPAVRLFQMNRTRKNK